MRRAVIFDLDDTLYDYATCHQVASEAVRELACRRLGVTSHEWERCLYQAKGIVKARLGNTAASHNRILYFQTALELLGFPPIPLSMVLYNCYWDTMLDTMRPFTYVIPLLKDLRGRGIRVAVLTNLTALIQHRKLERLGLASYVDVLVTSEEAGEEKPGRAMFDLVLEKLGCRPEETVMVGDSLSADLQGAAAAGIPGILFSGAESRPAGALSPAELQRTLAGTGGAP